MMNKTIDYYDTNAKAFSDDTLNLDFAAKEDKFIEAVRDAYKPDGNTNVSMESVQAPLVLDFGCGSGRDSRYFLQHGLRVDAVDGSRAMCDLASKAIGYPVRHMLFSDLSGDAVYDGIWACSSILHLPKAELSDVLKKMHRALKPGGVIYSSFKYGDFEGERNGRYFTNLTEDSLGELLKAVPGLRVIDLWITTDVRPGRENEKWLNVLLKRVD